MKKQEYNNGKVTLKVNDVFDDNDIQIHIREIFDNMDNTYITFISYDKLNVSENEPCITTITEVTEFFKKYAKSINKATQFVSDEVITDSCGCIDCK